MLEGDVEIGEDLTLRHQRHDFIDMRIGVDIMQPHPRIELAEFLDEIGEFRPHLTAAIFALREFEIDAIGARILRNDEQLLDPGFGQPFRLIEDGSRRPAHQIAAQGRDDAEGTAIVAAFRNLHISVMTWRQAQSLRRDEVELRVMRRRNGVMHGRHDGFILMGAGDRQDRRMGGADRFGFTTHAAGDDDATVLIDRLADGGKRFGFS
jgi:hypothetical protein